jgi:hypothetical protein
VIAARAALVEASDRAAKLFTKVRFARGLTRLRAMADAGLGSTNLTCWALGDRHVMSDRIARALTDWLAREPTR